MANNLASPYRLGAFKLILIQGCVAIIAAVMVFIGWGVNASLSALAGGAIAVLPNFVFALYAFRYVGATKARHVYASFKRGSGLKFLLTVFLFALLFKFSTVMALPFFLLLHSSVIYTMVSTGFF